MQQAKNPTRSNNPNFNLHTYDARLLDRAINERGWTLEPDDYVARIRDGQTLNAGLNNTGNSY